MSSLEEIKLRSEKGYRVGGFAPNFESVADARDHTCQDIRTLLAKIKEDRFKYHAAEIKVRIFREAFETIEDRFDSEVEAMLNAESERAKLLREADEIITELEARNKDAWKRIKTLNQCISSNPFLGLFHAEDQEDTLTADACRQEIIEECQRWRIVVEEKP